MNPILDSTQFVGLMCVSALVCALVILIYPGLVTYLKDRDDLGSVQCAHSQPTPRIGGVGVLLATLIALLVLAPDGVQRFCALFAVTLLPVFAAGLAEDLGWRVSPRARLAAAGCSAVLAVALLQVWIPLTGLAWLDVLLSIAPLAIVITVVWTTGVCHALNLIDGVNGLAGAVGLLIAAGLALVAHEATATGFATVAAALVPALLGFLVFNWPLGRIFLGDAGAYTLGHVLVWLAIGLAWHSSAVSAVALSLMFFWPVADTFLAIVRRLRSRRPIGAPDRLHYHQLVMRALLLMSQGRLSRGTANSLTTLVLLPFIAAPIATAVHFWDQPMAAMLAWLVFGALFTASYLIGIAFFCGPGRSIARQVLDRIAPRPARLPAAQ